MPLMIESGAAIGWADIFGFYRECRYRNGDW
jgi:hypothetical protein